MAQLNRRHGSSISLSIGVHSGPLLAGVLDPARPVYGIWGSTGRVARRLGSAAPAGEIYVSAETRQKLGDTFHCEERALGGESGLVYQLQLKYAET